VKTARLRLAKAKNKTQGYYSTFGKVWATKDHWFESW